MLACTLAHNTLVWAVLPPIDAITGASLMSTDHALGQFVRVVKCTETRGLPKEICKERASADGRQSCKI